VNNLKVFRMKIDENQTFNQENMTHSHKNAAWHHLAQQTCSALSIDAQLIKSVRGHDSLESVVKALKSRDVLSAPVLDDKAHVLGVIDLTDLLTFLVKELAVTH
jgi:CBS-domain-containing membrane protein